VGEDENPIRREKSKLAFDYLRELLSGEGIRLITVPLNSNPLLNGLIYEGNLFDAQCFLKRISRDNRWEESGLPPGRSKSFSSETLIVVGAMFRHVLTRQAESVKKSSDVVLRSLFSADSEVPAKGP
jgi:hypothetical protein